MNHYVTYFTLFLVYYLGFIKAEQPVIAIYIRCYVPHYDELNVNDYIVYTAMITLHITGYTTMITMYITGYAMMYCPL